MYKLKKILSYILIISLIFNSNLFFSYAAKDEYIGGGFILYDGVAYAKGNDNSKRSSDFFNALDKFASKYPMASVSFIPVIQSQICIEDIQGLTSKLANQKETINKFSEMASDKVKVINTYDRLKEHLSEYLFFKYDNHWTSRAAYYAYQEFCEYKNIHYSNINSYKEVLINSKYVGSAYSFSKDERVKNKTDVIYAYVATANEVMKVYDNKNRLISEGKSINTDLKNYNAFILGDNPWTTIEVLDSKSDKSILIVKDSFGCALVPYFVSNYKNIYVVDPRFAKFKIYDKIQSVDDILFVTAIYVPGAKSVVNNIKSLIS